MVNTEISKYDTIYNLHHCDPSIVIPTNDLDAWVTYPKYNWIYNRLQLAQMQNIKAAPMPIQPDTFPVIIKPIVNLYGMGLNIKKITSMIEFEENWYNNDFWMEFLDGEHLSIDILLIKGQIIWHATFTGHKMDNNLGLFKYWESIDTVLDPNVIEIVSKLDNFTGCVNIETIGNKIIEGHLRMGDITKLPNDNIIDGIISIYQEKIYLFPATIPKIYLFPIWLHTDCQLSIALNTDNKMRGIVKSICKYAYSYQIDKGTEACPNDLRRVMMISTFHYETGINIINDLYSYLHSI